MRNALPFGIAGIVLLAVGVLGYVVLRTPAEPRVVADANDAGPPPAPSDAGVPPPGHAGRQPNILLFTIDALRADHLGAWGYERDTSPTIDALAARGTRFTRAYSTSSWTLPAVASLLSGVLPSEHGTTHSGMSRDGTAHQDFLSAELPSLVEALHDIGYRTVGVTANPHLLGEAGFARGFDLYHCETLRSSEREHDAIWERLDTLRDGEQPWFLWVHVTDPHGTYQPREPQFTRWWGTSRARHPALEQSIFLLGLRHVVAAQGISLEEGLAYVTTAYDSEIRATDDLLEELLVELDDGELAVVVTAAYGEELDDHHQMGHGMTLFDEVVHVPLVVALPEQTPRVVSTPISILDVLPTLAEIADAPVHGGAGISLVSAVHGAPLPSRDIVMESGRLVPIQGILDSRYAFIELLGRRPIEVLFDLQTDPTERSSCLADHPDVATAMQARLHGIVADAASRRRETVVTRIEVPEEIRENLRALGYEQPE